MAYSYSYNLDTVKEYLEGGELDGFDVDELEDNPAFMRDAIFASGDKRLYDHCTDKVKSDEEFVSFMINRFKDDVEFIDRVANYYINSKPVSEDRELESMPIVAQMCEILKGRDRALFIRYKTLFHSFFLSEMVDNYDYKTSDPTDTDFDLGFRYFQQISQDDLVLRYYAEQLMYYILTDVTTIKAELLNNFKSPEEVRALGINNFLFQMFKKYDYNLSSYLAIHAELLKPLASEVDDELVKWDKNKEKIKENKIEEVLWDIHEYYKTVEQDSILSEVDYIYYIGKELGVNDMLSGLGGLDMELYEKRYAGQEDEFVKNALSNMQERVIYSNIRRIMRSGLFGEEPPEPVGGKIVEIPFDQMKL